MGWANCGTDRTRRPIGYAHTATCDFPGCKAKIDRGLSFACGGMHGEDEISCDKYFCEKHLSESLERDGMGHRICAECAKTLLESGDWIEDEEEGVIVQVEPNHPEPTVDNRSI